MNENIKIALISSVTIIIGLPLTIYIMVKIQENAIQRSLSPKTEAQVRYESDRLAKEIQKSYLKSQKDTLNDGGGK